MKEYGIKVDGIGIVRMCGIGTAARQAAIFYMGEWYEAGYTADQVHLVVKDVE